MYNLIKNFMPVQLIDSEKINSASYPFMVEYLENKLLYDRNFKKKYGNLILDNDLIGLSNESTISNISDGVTEIISLNKNTLNRLYANISIEYNAINNYDRHETITERVDGSKENVLELLGNETDTNIIGNSTITNVSGNSKITNSNGERSSTNENLKYTYDSDNYNNDNKEINTISPSVDTTDIDAKTDTTNIDAKTDTITKSFENRKNKNTENYIDFVKTTENTTSGNIGVTTSQQMLQSDIDLWKNYNFWKYLFELIANEISIGVYGIYDDVL